MKQISTFLVLFLLVSCNYGYSQCSSSLGTNAAGNRIVMSYVDAAARTTANVLIGAPATGTVTLDGTAYALELHPTNGRIIRTANLGGGTFDALYNVNDNPNADPVTVTLTLADNSTVECSYDAMGVLPVDLLSFTATSEKRATENVLLEWATASEQNSSHFIIEHSTDGRNFTALEKVEGMGTYDDLTEYSFTHKGAQNGRNFYRLQQVDFDGEYSFSAIEQVSIATNNMSIKQTLVADMLQVNLNAENATDISYQVVNAAGQSVQAGTLSIYTSQQEINVSNLNSGIYFLQVAVNGETSATKFVKQ